jgi:hypothetical protein
VAALDARINALYQGPLSSFTAERLALARTLTGAEARQVKTLPKPTVVPWSVNQVFWHARPLYDGVMRSGEQRRAAEIAALKGRPADAQAASSRHRQAVRRAVAAATKLASAHGVHPSDEALRRMFEVVSLSGTPREPHGRLTKQLQPAGFEALADVAIAPAGHGPAPHLIYSSKKAPPRPPSAAALARARRAEQERAAAARRRREAIRKAEAAVARATIAEVRARDAWERSHERVRTAERELAQLRATPLGRSTDTM